MRIMGADAADAQTFFLFRRAARASVRNSLSWRNMARATSLLKAFINKSIPSEGAIIISSHFDPASLYSIYEITAFAGAASPSRGPEGFSFPLEGERLYVLAEPPGCEDSTVGPRDRGEGRSIPLEFGGLFQVEGKDGGRILVSRRPLRIGPPFTVANAGGEDFSFLFYRTDDIGEAIRAFIADVLYNDSGAGKDEALKAAELVFEGVVQFTFEGPPGSADTTWKTGA